MSTHVQELLKLELLVELGSQPDGRVGRPHSDLALNRSGHCGIGVEINVDYIAVCVSDLLDEVRFHRVEVADNRGLDPRHVLDRAAELVRTAIAAAEREGLAPAGVAAAVAGTVELETGAVLVAPNLGLDRRAGGRRARRAPERPSTCRSLPTTRRISQHSQSSGSASAGRAAAMCMSPVTSASARASSSAARSSAVHEASPGRSATSSSIATAPHARAAAAAASSASRARTRFSAPPDCRARRRRHSAIPAIPSAGSSSASSRATRPHPLPSVSPPRRSA